MKASEMSGTPRTDAFLECVDGDAGLIDPARVIAYARELERELAAIDICIDDLCKYHARLHEKLDAVESESATRLEAYQAEAALRARLREENDGLRERLESAEREANK